MLRYFFAKSKSILDFAHLLIYHSHVVLGALLLIFFRHAKNLAVAFSDVLHKIGTIAN
jgi:hypothetical protein